MQASAYLRGVPGSSEPDLWYQRLDVEGTRRIQPAQTDSNPGDGPLMVAGPVSDRALMTPGSAVLVAASLPTMARAMRSARRVERTWRYYTYPEFLEDTTAFFQPPPPGVEPVARRVRATFFRPADGTVADLYVASPFEPVNPRMRSAYLKAEGNMLAHARYWRHESGPRKTVVCVHGYMASNHVLNTELFKVKWLYERGLDVLLYTLPFHGSRAPIIDGLGFPSFDLGRVAEGFGHAIFDFRILANWLFDQGAPSLGVMGASLGGYFTSLAAAVEDRLDFAVPIIPATSLVDVCAEWWPASLLLQALLARVGWTMDDARLHTAAHTPLQFAPRLPKDRLLIIAANRDLLTRPYQAQLLWEHWDRPEIHWYAGSHVLHVRRTAYLRQLGRFLAGIGAFDARGAEMVEAAAGFDTTAEAG